LSGVIQIGYKISSTLSQMHYPSDYVRFLVAEPDIQELFTEPYKAYINNVFDQSSSEDTFFNEITTTIMSLFDSDLFMTTS
jgi:hypothetical protein